MDSGPVTAVKGIGDHCFRNAPKGAFIEDWEQQGSSPLSAVPFCVHSVSPPMPLPLRFHLFPIRRLVVC